MLSIIKNNLDRMLEQKLHVIVAVGLTICSVVLAIVLTGKIQPKMNIAVVGEKVEIAAIDQVRIINLEEEPPESTLVQKQYDAIVVVNEDGSYRINTEQGEEFRQTLEAVLKGQTSELPVQDDGRKIGTNIIGYMLMFLLMQGNLYARMFAEDKEKHQIERVACSPLPFWKYLMGHGVFIWLFIWIPSFLVVAVSSFIGVDMGFSLWQYAVLIAIVSVMSVGLALCVNSFFCVADTANMVGTCIIVLSSILAGSYYDMSNGSDLLSKVLYVLPQKGFLMFTDAWEKHAVYLKPLLGVIYVIILSVVLITIGIVKTRKKYIYHRS